MARGPERHREDAEKRGCGWVGGCGVWVGNDGVQRGVWRSVGGGGRDG